MGKSFNIIAAIEQQTVVQSVFHISSAACNDENDGANFKVKKISCAAEFKWRQSSFM